MLSVQHLLFVKDQLSLILRRDFLISTRRTVPLTFQCVRMSDFAVVVPLRREDTHREFNPATDMNYSSSPPSLQKGEGQLTPSLTFVQRYERLRENQRRL